jgi:hypothetical protein
MHIFGIPLGALGGVTYNEVVHSSDYNQISYTSLASYLGFLVIAYWQLNKFRNISDKTSEEGKKQAEEIAEFGPLFVAAAVVDGAAIAESIQYAVGGASR